MSDRIPPCRNGSWIAHEFLPLTARIDTDAGRLRACMFCGTLELGARGGQRPVYFVPWAPPSVPERAE